MLENFPQPIIFAHRGACAHAPENTLASFELALRQGAPAVELDAKLSADQQVIVIHDSTLERTTGTPGLVRDFSIVQLQELDAGSFFSAEFRGEKIPTLEAVFETVGKRLIINVELTNYSTPRDELVDHVVDLVRRMGLEKHVLFSSFNPSNLIRARRLMPQIPLGLLALDGQQGAVARSFLGRLIPHEALHPYRSDVSERLVRSVHAQGRKVYVWTVNDPQDMRRLFSAGADGIFTDDPALALQVLAEKV